MASGRYLGESDPEGMALNKNKYIFLSESSIRRSSGESWLEILQRWSVQCPQCQEIWLVIGAHENDRYVCKNCGHAFAIKLSSARKNVSGEVKQGTV